MTTSARECTTIVMVGVALFALFAAPAVQSANVECLDSDLPILCHGARVARSVANMKPLKLMDGVEIVRIDASTEGGTKDDPSSNNQRSTTGFAYADRVLQYLQGHEIKINMHEVLQQTGVTDVVARAMKEIESENEVVEARKKDKGGLSTVLITALMMKKLLAALGMAAIAALSAKALGVATLALILSMLLGIKKLSEPVNDVKYHTEHHRKRREVDGANEMPLPYRGWTAAAAPTTSH